MGMRSTAMILATVMAASLMMVPLQADADYQETLCSIKGSDTIINTANQQEETVSYTEKVVDDTYSYGRFVFEDLRISEYVTVTVVSPAGTAVKEVPHIRPESGTEFNVPLEITAGDLGKYTVLVRGDSSSQLRQWTLDIRVHYMVSYDTGTFGHLIGDSDVVKGSSVVLPTASNTSREVLIESKAVTNYVFSYWTTVEGDYLDPEDLERMEAGRITASGYTPTSDITLYAVFVLEGTYTETYRSTYVV